MLLAASVSRAQPQLRRSFSTTSTLARSQKKRKGPKNAATPKTKQIKMPEPEFAEKIAPISYAQQDLTNYELPPLHQTSRGLETNNWEVVLPFPPSPFTNPTSVDNVKWRNGFANMVSRVCGLHGVFPDLLNEFLPRLQLIVEYPHNYLIHWGRVIGPAMLQETPKIDWSVPTKKRIYTVLCVGQDVDDSEQFVHWMITNVPGNYVSEGETVANYIPPQPTINGGLHRYVFILLSQKERITVENPGWNDKLESRGKFNTKEFCEKYGLTPKGISFLHSRWHPSVAGPETRLRHWFRTKKEGEKKKKTWIE